MRVALAQMNIVWEDKESNIGKIVKWLDFAKSSNVDAIFFPEMSLTGFSMDTGVTAESGKESVRIFEGLASEFGLSIGLGWVGQGDSLCENHYSIIKPDSGEALDYVKIHPFSYSGEDQYFQGGSKLASCKLNDVDVGAVICYDLRFPEIFQILSEKVDFIVIAANWPEQRRSHWLALLEARAIENQCFIAGVNCCGMMNDKYYSGDSCLFLPDGNIAEAVEMVNMDERCPEEKLIIYDIDNNVSSVRNAFPVKQDRKKELYKELVVSDLKP